MRGDRRLVKEAERRGEGAKEDERFIDVVMPGDYLYIRLRRMIVSRGLSTYSLYRFYDFEVSGHTSW
ncbi:MAG: hypothetical protein LZ166_02210 [Thaumarchaeota archaeon]|jgi:hypothetical protein|nr:hypothetical protein [Nitrososphaerota archaeon]MCL7386329.1 hypothetical protein [Candidatus Wolframiiraptor allenii]